MGFDRLPVILLVPHVDAGDRTKWTTDQDFRPLTELGRLQASELAEVVGRADRIVSSPARRCVETVEPIAAASGVAIELSDDLRELPFTTEHEVFDPWQPDPSWHAQLGAAAALGRATRVLEELEGTGGRVVLSAHGDLVPLLAMLAAGHFRVGGVQPVARGGCYQIDGTITSLGALLPPPPA